jgi:hypothetical protein
MAPKMNFKSAADIVYPHVVGIITTSKLVFNLPQEEPKFSVGTGLILDQSGLILTAHHVLPTQGWKMMVGTNAPNKVPKVGFVDYDVVADFPQHDLAIIKVSGSHLDLSYLSGIRKVKFSYDIPSYGVPLGSFGYPLPRWIMDDATHTLGPEVDLRFKSFYVSSIFAMPHTTYIVMDSFCYGGHSGGPVFDWEGKVLGIVIRTELKERQTEVSYSHASVMKNIQKEISLHQSKTQKTGLNALRHR